MELIDITESLKEDYNKIVTHPLQSFEWGEFRKKTGVTVIRKGLVKNKKIVEGFTITIHKIPKTKFTIGYLPKGVVLTKEALTALQEIGKENNCIFIQLEPNITIEKKESWDKSINNFPINNSFHPLFTKFTFVLDISKPDEDLLKSFHHKTRYNIKIAMKRKVKVVEDSSDKSFKEYLQLTHETTTRQKFYAHTPSYHTKMWETLKENSKNGLSAHLLKAVYRPEGKKNEVTLAAWILFTFHDTLYYPYGASSSLYRNVMASNLIMWEAIRFGKKQGLQHFDMWGALGENPNPKDAWYGFHKFKEGYGATHTEFVGSYDLVINPVLYQLYKVADKARWTFLRIKKFV